MTQPRSAAAAVALAGWQSLLFGGMAALCLYVTAMLVLHPAASGWYVVPLYVAGALAAWYNPVAAVFGFVVAIPFVNGIAVASSAVLASPYNTVFSGIYLAWLIKRLFVRRKGLYPPTGAAFLIDILSTAALCSLLTLLLGYPRLEVYPAVFDGITLDQHQFLYAIQAAVVFTQGLFLYRLLELEADAIGGYQAFARALLAITAIVIGFSLLQFVFDVPVWRGLIAPGKRGLLAPLDDSNSYGSTVVLLFSVALFMAHGSHGRSRITNLTAAFLLAWCAVFSLSRATWVGLAAVVMVFVWQLRRKLALVATAGMLSLAVLTIALVQIRSFDLPFIPYSTHDLSSPASLNYRLFKWQITTAMIREVPLSGAGIGSYLRLFPFYSNYDPALDGSNHFALRAPENAHNYFLQLAAELGLPALAVFLVLLSCLFRSAFGRLASEPGATPFVKGLMVGVGAYLLSCLTGHPLLLPAQQFIFWFAMAALTITPNRGPVSPSARPGRSSRVGLALLCVAMIAGYSYRAYTLPESTGYQYGLYPVEYRGSEKIEWTKKDAGRRVMATSDVIGFKVIADRHNIGARGLDLTITVNGKELERRTIFRPGAHQFFYYVPGIAKTSTTVQFSVSRTFNPRGLGLSEDSRDLGIVWAPVTFLPRLPPDGVGFYEWETLDASSLPLITGEKTVPFRWTQRQATIPLDGRPRDAALVVLLCATHPDSRALPVSLELMSDGRVVRTVSFTDAAWKRVEIPAEAIRGAKALTLRVDRTWNPRRAGVSDDSRDLGVGVILR